MYESKIHHFSHVIMLHFYFGYFLSWFAVMLKYVRSNIHVILKIQYTFYGIQFGQNIKDLK